MIDLYTWTTPNGRKVSIMLEELGVDYEAHPINIGQDDQFTPEFIAINPNSKIPAIVDRDGPGGQPYTVIESGAILMYLAEKSGKFLPQETAAPILKQQGARPWNMKLKTSPNVWMFFMN